MSHDIIIQLKNIFGHEQIKICNEYHIQVNSPRGKHNIWMTGNGTLKLQLCGCRQVIAGLKISTLIKKIKQYSFTESDLAMMEHALNLTKFIQQSIVKKTNGIFVDAGWKDGVAKIAVILIIGDHVAAESYRIAAENSMQAELHAINFALNWKPFEFDGTIQIYTDCKAAIDWLCKNGKRDPRIQWISREKNSADKIGNMRNA
jgi:hypothetical protein